MSIYAEASPPRMHTCCTLDTPCADIPPQIQGHDRIRKAATYLSIYHPTVCDMLGGHRQQTVYSTLVVIQEESPCCSRLAVVLEALEVKQTHAWCKQPRKVIYPHRSPIAMPSIRQHHFTRARTHSNARIQNAYLYISPSSLRTACLACTAASAR